MAERYDPVAIERKWRERWEEDGLYRTPDASDRPKWYHLTMFPYTSGDLHIGHWYAMAPSDAAARYKRMRGHNVLFPIGFDAFGLPAENAAIKRGIHPATWTLQNVERMRGQLKSMGAMFDWSREVITCLPEYYRWNQWFFLQFLKRGLAYKALAPAWWCPTDQTVLANEQVVDGRCERCGTEVYKRDLDQWFFRITAYADELLDFSQIDWPEQVTTMQRNWIGRSEGVEIAFDLEQPVDDVTELRVFTTRPDTVYGVTFMVLAPEHPLVDKITTPAQRAAVNAYIDQARRESEIERLSTEREKTGVFTGAYCINKLSGQRVQIWIADYVLLSYGTGIVMGVPAHDYRDFAFATKYGIPVRVVIAPPGYDGRPLADAYVGPGQMINSGPFDGTWTKGDWEKLSAGERQELAETWHFDVEEMQTRLESLTDDGKKAVGEYVERQGWGKQTVTYRLRDWLLSRQRYWGCPIPVVYCDACGIVPVPEDHLPVLLPEDAEFRPTGESPLTYHEAFVHTTCPQCNGPARRETDTMDTFVDSSWYQMRYVDPHNSERPVSPEKAAAWLPVDQYTGGAEHAVMHLLYARFFWKVARDLGVVSGDEPFVRLFCQGQILGPDGQRMSKSRGNVVAPDEQVERYGADTFRAYLMFLGPWDEGGPFDLSGIAGIWRWLNRVWTLVLDAPETAALPDAAATREMRRLTHRTIQRVTDDFDRFRWNTAIAALMECTNGLARLREQGPVDTAAWAEATEALVLMMAPLTPHIAEELWAQMGRPYSVHTQPWPVYEPALTAAEEVTLVVQVNGKLRDRLTVPADIAEDQAKNLALASEKVRSQLNGSQVERVIYVPGRLVNVVLKGGK
jgi:leucyl-tRNA synthetase